MADVTLVYSSTTVTLPAPDHPEELNENLIQRRARAMGGRVVSITRSTTTISNPIFHWSYLSEAKYNALKTFIYTTVKGTQLPFTYTDHEGTAQANTYYMGGLESAVSQDYDAWRVDLQLAYT
jgi:hypothetical protein